MKITENRTPGPSRKRDNPRSVKFDNSSNLFSEPVVDTRCSCLPPSTSNRQTFGATDEREICQDDSNDRAPPLETVTEQPVEPIERPLDGHVTSRFPVSFTRTRLPNAPVSNGPSASKHCRRCTCNLRSNSVLAPYPNRAVSDGPSQSHRGGKVKEVFVYRRANYLVKEAVFLATC
jgi:hypothetical protein